MLPHRLNAAALDCLETTLPERLLAEPDVRFVVQFSAPEQYPPELLHRLDALCAQFAERVEVRFYGHYSGDPFDARILSALPNTRALVLDCLQNAVAVQAIQELGALTSLGVGIENLDLSPIVALPNLRTLRKLRLYQQMGAKVDLSPIARMSNLQVLSLGARSLGLKPLHEHPVLTSLNLHSQPAQTKFDVVATLPRLKTLGISFGSRQAMPELHSTSVREFELMRVRGLHQFEPGCFPALQALQIEDQPHLQSLDIGTTPKLRTLKLCNLKSLATLPGLGTSALAKLWIARTPGLDLLKLLDEPLPPLEALRLATGKRKLDEQIDARQNALGIATTVTFTPECRYRSI